MTLMIVLVVLGSSLLLSFVTFRRAKSSLMSQLEDNCAVDAQKYALELTSWVNTNGTIIDTVAAEIAVNGISDQDYDTFHSYLKHSNELLNKNGYVYDVYFTYPDNTMVCASDFIPDGTVDFVHEREWYTTSALTGELFFSTPYLDSDTQKPVITISKAVYRGEELLGVLAADIFVDVIVDIINDADVGENSYAFLVDQNMGMVVHPDDTFDYDEKPINIMAPDGSPYGRLIDTIFSHSHKMFYITDYDGITRGITYARMSNTGWYVCVATSKDQLDMGASSLVRGFVIATIVSILLGVIIAVFLATVLDKLNRQEQEYKEQVLKLEKQAADEASKAKSRFLTDMSHEIRTPINAIIGMNEMIMRETTNSDIRGYSKNIKRSGRALLQLINGILDFSKIEEGKMEIVDVRYSLADQIAYYHGSMNDRANSKGLKLVFDIDPDLPSELYGDDTRISQIITNLLTNAVKYTEKGSVTLRIKCIRKEEDRVLLGVEVEDTGIGIKESDMARLFESFERLDLEKNRNIEGTGLGMTITRQLLELMGSKLIVKSVYGEGSVFSFELWQKVMDADPIGDYTQSISPLEDDDIYTESFHASNARILVVDDTKMNIMVVENLLKRTGIMIDTALSGPEAIELAGQNQYDVILMDQRMPDMDGTEAMKRIRELPDGNNTHTPVICLTADVIRGAKDRYMEQGFDDYLTKPVNGAALEKMLMHYLPDDKIGDTNGGIAGVDTNAGLKYCGNDREMYRSILEAFCGEKEKKSGDLANSFEAEDWEKYGVYIHSLKSTAKTIGAFDLSDMAASLEAAAKSGNIGTVRSGHDKTMRMYDKVVTDIRKSINADTAGTNDDEEILEFDPE